MFPHQLWSKWLGRDMDDKSSSGIGELLTNMQMSDKQHIHTFGDIGGVSVGIAELLTNMQSRMNELEARVRCLEVDLHRRDAEMDIKDE